MKAERVRLAAGRAPLQARQRAAWSELAGRVADTRRASPDEAGTWRGDGHGAWEKKARRAEAGRAGAARGWAGPRRGARRAGARWAGFGWRARSEAAAQKNRNRIFQFIFKKFLNAIFQILF